MLNVSCSRIVYCHYFWYLVKKIKIEELCHAGPMIPASNIKRAKANYPSKEKMKDGEIEQTTTHIIQNASWSATLARVDP